MTLSSRVALDAVLLDLIRSKPQTARDLERSTTSAHSAIARRLQVLAEHGKIHGRINPFNVDGRPPRVWFIGAGPEAPIDPKDLPQRIITKARSVGAPRDPLVTALFGPAENAPRCTHCEVVEGGGHRPGCAVARFV